MMELKESRREINNLLYIITQNLQISTTDKQQDFLKKMGRALDKSLECIDKQIPLSLYKNKYCMCCKRDLSIETEHFAYCPNCGQRIDWDNEEFSNIY